MCSQNDNENEFLWLILKWLFFTTKLFKKSLVQFWVVFIKWDC